MTLTPSVHWVWPGEGVVSTADRGLAYGDGLFETLALTARGPVLLASHLGRLLSGCRLLGLPCTPEILTEWWQEAHLRFLRVYPQGTGLVKLMVTRGAGGRGYRPPRSVSPTFITSFHPLPAMPAAPVVTRVCRQRLTPGALPGCKSLNRLDQVMASRELGEHIFEGLMLDAQGRLVEGTRTNLLLFTGGAVITPPVSQLAVRGVMRDWLVAQGVIKEATLSVRDLAASNGLALVNSVMGVIPVAKVDCLYLPISPVVEKIRRLVADTFGFQPVE